MLRFERLEFDSVDWAYLDSLPDRTIFQTRPWLTFIARTQRAEPVIARLRDGAAELGYFTGLITTRYRLRILGSPFPGWTTAYMGFNFPGVLRREAVRELSHFAFSELRCVHVELMDRHLTLDDGRALSLGCRVYGGFEVDLSRSERELYAAMDSNRRRGIRKAEASGVVIEEARDVGFADDYYAQLTEVFARQRLVPTYGQDRVPALIDCLLRTGMLLLLRALDANGQCIATGIFPAMNDTMYFWGGASWHQHRKLHPYEAIHWYAMRYWQARGIRRYDMGGGGDFKRRYGGRDIFRPLVQAISISRDVVCARRSDAADQGAATDAGSDSVLSGGRSDRGVF